MSKKQEYRKVPDTLNTDGTVKRWRMEPIPMDPKPTKESPAKVEDLPDPSDNSD